MSVAARNNIRTVLANCAQFRTWMGVGTVELAAAKVFMHSASATAAPVCVLYDEEDQDTRIGYCHFADSGTVRVVIDVQVPAGQSEEARFNTVDAALDVLRGQILAWVCANGPDVGRVRKEGLMRSAEGDASPYVQAVLLVDWGAS